MSYVTKDSGERQTFSTGMVRDSAAKELRPDLLPVEMLRRWRDSDVTRGDNTPSSLRARAFDYFVRWFDDAPIDDDDSAAAVFELIEECELALEHGPMLVRWAELMGRGAIKYGERNWEKAETQEELERFKASAFRHFVQWFYGLNKEEDHAAGVFFNIAGAEYVKGRMRPACKTYEIVVTFDKKPFESFVSHLEEVTTKLEEATLWVPTAGDRVRIKGSAGPVGSEGEIVDILTEEFAREWPYRIRTNRDDCVGLYRRGEFERISGASAKVEEAVSESAPSWEPQTGERVRVLEGTNIRGAGREGSLERNAYGCERFPFLVRFDDGDYVPVTRREIGPVSGAV